MAAKRVIIGDQEIQIPDFNFKFIPVLTLVLIAWLLTGVFMVNPDEVGVIRTFGKFTRIVEPGLNYHFPYPIQMVNTPAVTEIKRIEIGFRTLRNGQYRTVEKESMMLTGDENIVDAEMIVQYKIKDPVPYLFSIVEPELTVREAAEASLRTVVGRNKIDETLTTGKSLIQEDTKMQLQEILDKYNSGIHIVAVQLQDVSPPKPVIAFKTSCNLYNISIFPCWAIAGVSGCMKANCSILAILSFTLGLYFIVQLPNGYDPTSTP